MKKTLAHEFGHHWTLGYMIENFEQDIWKERMPLDYYRMRGLDLDNFAPDYSKDWYHCDKEVLAEDYKYFYSPFDGEHRMKNLVGNPSEEIKAKIVDLGLGARRSWEELVRCRFSKSK
ncbi:hypothetical protein [Methanosarcina barkeri]|nr:hypothetical protein [Methanosarcina barkeri]